ncbi:MULTISPECIES: hypothetical protein [unclassified Ketobacter]|uniref:hypothetical protein n=1 Tax=unclassified Ketobacter TaxID=2639109 RepID=UPI000F295F9E|nr:MULTISPECIES: hypothetical protein [unclassified Ketobacter]RLT87903.1 MAG: hypothetical protein D9N13_22790 [Ketobacter sp. GenoA1]RLT96433.1 MAG: hypothetical protein D9N15_09980 [Ketobacter sp.]
MYMPVDPNSIDGMWDKLLQSLSSQKNCVVVSDGQVSDEPIDESFSNEEADSLLAKLKSREYVRIGSSRMSPVPAHFAIDFTDSTGRLMELISLSSDDERLRNDVSLVCQFSFFENKKLERLFIPFVITGLEDPELKFEVDESAGATVAYRI